MCLVRTRELVQTVHGAIIQTIVMKDSLLLTGIVAVGLQFAPAIESESQFLTQTDGGLDVDNQGVLRPLWQLLRLRLLLIWIEC